MSLDSEVNSLMEVDQTATTEPLLNRFMAELIIITVFILGIFVIFPTTPKKTNPVQVDTFANRLTNRDSRPEKNQTPPKLAPPLYENKQLTVRRTEADLNSRAQDIAARKAQQAQDNQILIERLYAEVLNTGDLTVARELFAQPFYYHELGWPRGIRGFETVKRLVTRNRSEMTDIRYAIHELTVDREMVTVRWTASGTTNDFFVPETMLGRQMSWSGITIWQLRYGKVAAAWTPWSLGVYSDGDSLP